MEHMFCEGEKSSKERLALLLHKVTKSKKKLVNIQTEMKVLNIGQT